MTDALKKLRNGIEERLFVSRDGVERSTYYRIISLIDAAIREQEQAEKPLQLRDGGWYEQWNGEIVGPMRAYPCEPGYFDLGIGIDGLWRPDGTDVYGDNNHLIREVPEPEEAPSAIDDLVDRFAVALKEKLHAAEKKYGYSDGWLQDDWRDELALKLREHVLKGDPRDVAAYCAFAWHHGWSVADCPYEVPAPQAVKAQPWDWLEKYVDSRIDTLWTALNGIEQRLSELEKRHD